MAESTDFIRTADSALAVAARDPFAGIPTEPFVPRWPFNGGHKQTLASHFLRRSFDLALAAPGLTQETREVETEPGTRLKIICHWQPSAAAAKASQVTLLILHGLEGSGESGYMMGTAAKALAAGMNVVRMNQRNCGGMDYASPTLYHSGLSSDVKAVAHHLIERDGVQRLVLSGFSMGGNLVLKTTGEWGAEHPPQVKGTVAISPALDLAASADALHELQNRAYEWHFVRSLHVRFRRKAALFPGQGYDVSRLQGANSVRTFDNQITAPYGGFGNADNYYAKAAAANVVGQITLPTLVIHAADDPFIIITPQSRAQLEANPNIHYVETCTGGHCAFLAPPNQASAYDGRWAERQIVAFAQHF